MNLAKLAHCLPEPFYTREEDLGDGYSWSAVGPAGVLGRFHAEVHANQHVLHCHHVWTMCGGPSLVETLKWYAEASDDGNWSDGEYRTLAQDDGGRRAQEALDGNPVYPE